MPASAVSTLSRPFETPASPPSADAIFRLGLGFWASRTLLSAVELGLFTGLADGPATLHDLRRRFGLHERSARDFLDALVALNMLERREDIYANTPETGTFLDRNQPTYVGGVLEMAAGRLWPMWGRLTDSLRSGNPQSIASADSGDLFDTLYNDPERLKAFLKAMTGTSLPAAQAISRLLPWNDFATFVDVGCAEGGLSVVLAGNHPHLKGVGFDLPQVQPVFEDHARANGLSERLQFAAGDFFKDSLPGADVLILGHILHDWNLKTKRMLLGKAYAALPEGGRLVVYEMLIDDERSKNAMGLLMSLNMLVETVGGFDFTGADCIGWMRDAGFRRASVHRLAGPYSAVVAVK
jgi:precorrin-6B methylase 2